MKRIKLEGIVYLIDKKGFVDDRVLVNLRGVLGLRKGMVLMAKEISYLDAEEEIKVAWRNEVTERPVIYGFETELPEDFTVTKVKRNSRKYEVLKNLGYEDLYEG